jgi:hypothetical protein
LGITCRSGVALTDTQKSEYWTIALYIPIPAAWNSSTCSLRPRTQIVTLPIFAHSVSPFVQQSTPEHLSLRLRSSSAVRGPETRAIVPDSGTCEDAALFWSSCKHMEGGVSPPAEPPRLVTRQAAATGESACMSVK